MHILFNEKVTTPWKCQLLIASATMAALAQALDDNEISTVSESNFEVRPIDHTKRAYQSFPGANYVLPSDALERERCGLHL